MAQPFVQTYKYDSLNRLKEARETANQNQTWIQNFDYDRYGNRITFSQNIGGIVKDQTPALVTASNRFQDGQGFGYDKNGNIKSDVDPNSLQAREFIFDGENKQTEVKQNGVAIGKYFYDGEGKRVKKVTNLETTIFVYSSGKLIAEYSTKLADYPSTNYTTTDQLGTPRVITDQTGAVKARRDFMPFGEEIYPDTVYRKSTDKYGVTDSVRQRFTGYQKDIETGLDFAEARYYNNQHGRFTAVDPLLASGKSANPQSFNRYAYVQNNPIIATDPSGLCGGPGESPCPANYSGSVYRNSNGTSFNDHGGEGWTLFKGITNYTNPYGQKFLVTTGGWSYDGDWYASNSALSSSRNDGVRSLIDGANERLGEIQSGSGKGAANAGINLVNGAISSLYETGGVTQFLDAPQIGKYKYNTLAEAKFGTAIETAAFFAPLVVGGVTGIAGEAEAVTPRFGNCFVAGTLITTESGLVPIEEIKSGDKVLSYNTETSGLEYLEVARLFRNTADEFLKIRVEGESELIQVTLGHPFYVHRNRSNLSTDTDGDWVLSKLLRVGDLLKDKTGAWKPILSIEKVAEKKATYNFEVAKNHDYFVGESGWLVHNQSFGNARFAAPAEGPAIATSRIELEASLKNAGLNFTQSTQTAENGLIFTDARNGNLFRVMEGSNFHPPRLITSASGGNPIAPWGGNIPSIIRGKSAVRSLTHFPLGP